MPNRSPASYNTPNQPTLFQYRIINPIGGLTIANRSLRRTVQRLASFPELVLLLSRTILAARRPSVPTLRPPTLHLPPEMSDQLLYGVMVVIVLRLVRVPHATRRRRRAVLRFDRRGRVVKLGTVQDVGGCA